MRCFQEQMALNKNHQSGSPQILHNLYGRKIIDHICYKSINYSSKLSTLSTIQFHDLIHRVYCNQQALPLN